MLEALNEALDNPAEFAPKTERPPSSPPGLGPVVELLKVLLRCEAERLGVASKLLATVSDLEEIAANDAADVAAYNNAIAAAPASTQLWAMIETCRCLFNLPQIAQASTTSRMTTWVMGTNDLAKEMRARQTPDRAPFHAALSLSVAAARLYGLTILDGVYNDIDNEEGLSAICEQGVDFGFDGKTLIHPKQVEICNRIFSPSEAEVAWVTRMPVTKSH